ncbi:MAG: hypothetical protein GC168_15885 [Candidatus Hydrogenedens sp.]|nr:hypothetical protein [Candidatus Hydrogenedens sp.]
MDVIVDGAGGFKLEGEPETVLAVVDAVLSYLRDRGRAMVGLVIDGDDVDPETLTVRFAEAPVDSVNSLAVTSRSVEELVNESLNELEKALPELPVACRQLAQVFQGESPEEGFEPFHRLAKIWEHVKAKQQALANILAVDLKSLEFDGRSLPAHLDELNGFLQEAVQALQDGDTVLLGDLLEYELAPRAEFEARIVDALRQAARAA